MGDSVLLFVLSQISILLFFACIALVLLRRKQKKLQSTLEQKITSLREILAQTKENAKQLINQAKSEAVSHKSCAESNDAPELVSDVTETVSEEDVESQPLEEVATTEVTAEEMVSSQISDPEDLPPLNPEDQDQVLRLQEELANQKKRIQTLEQFKILCFEIDSEWHQANSEVPDQAEVLKYFAPVEALLSKVQDLVKAQDSGEVDSVDSLTVELESVASNESEPEVSASDGDVDDLLAEMGIEPEVEDESKPESSDTNIEETASNDDVDDLLAEMGIEPELEDESKPESSDTNIEETASNDDVDALLADVEQQSEPEIEPELEATAEIKSDEPMSSDDVDDLLAELDQLTESAVKKPEE